jgi:hypothetical protein
MLHEEPGLAALPRVAPADADQRPRPAELLAVQEDLELPLVTCLGRIPDGANWTIFPAFGAGRQAREAGWLEIQLA